MRKLLVATFAGALLLFTPSAAFAGGGNEKEGCGYTRYCPDDNRDGAHRGGASSGDSERWYDCREDPFRDNKRYGTPCRYYSECTNYPRCED